MRDLLALVAAGSLLVAQQPPPQAAPPKPPPQTAPQQPAAQQPAGPSVVLNLPNASLAEVIDILARQLKINYILDPRVKGTITVQTYGEVRAGDVRGLLETILRVNGYSLVQVGELYRIIPAGDVNKLPIRPRVAGMNEIPDDETMVLNLAFLKFANAVEISKLIEQFLGEGAKMTVYEPANLLLLLDNGRNMRRSLELIAMFDDEKLADQRIRLYEMEYSRPSDMAHELERVVGTLGLAQKNAAVQFLPIDRINTLVAFAPNPGAFTELEKWVRRLDIEAKPPVGGTENFVFRVKYGRAENLSMAVTLLYMSQQLSPTDTFAYMYLMNMMNQLTVQQTARAGAVPGQVGGGMNPAYGVTGMGGMYGGMGGMYGGMGGGMMGLLPLLQGAGAGGFNPNMMGMNPNMMGMPGMVPQGGSPMQGRDMTGQYLGQQGGGGGQQQGGTQLKIPRIIPNPFDNTLLIQGTQQEYQQIVKLLEQIDVPPRQVLIEAKIYEVLLTDNFRYGVQAALQQAGTGASRQFLGTFGELGLQSLTAGWLVSQSRELFFTLNASQQLNKTKVIAAPSVMATDNIPASINVGTEVPVRTGASTGIGGSIELIQNRNTGVILTITPRVQSSGIVTMTIDQEVSQPLGTTGPINSPSFSRRNVQTQITVQDGDMIAIGGIIQERNANSTNGIPGIAKIPILGGLLGGKIVEKERTELVIFLTPRVVYDTPQLTDATEELKQRFRKMPRVIGKRDWPQ